MDTTTSETEEIDRRADFTGILPTELSQQIFGQIGPESLDNSLLVSRRWEYYSSRARAARGRRHVKLLIQTIGMDKHSDKTVTYWLWSKDNIKIIHEFFADLSQKYSLTDLSSFEWSFDNSFEADVAKLLHADSPAVMTVQLRISSAPVWLTYADNRLQSLYSHDDHLHSTMSYGVITRISTVVHN